MNEQLHQAMEDAIKVKIDAQQALERYEQGRKPLAAALKKATDRCAKLERCIYTGEYQPELAFESSEPSNTHTPAVPARRETAPANFFGRRDRTVKGAVH